MSAVRSSYGATKTWRDRLRTLAIATRTVPAATLGIDPQAAEFLTCGAAMRALPRTKRCNDPSARHRALEIIAAHPNGCTGAMLVAHDIPADVLTELVQSGLVMARVERVIEEEGFL